MIRNNGAEPQSLDPNKIEGVPEANISRDLFEGLLITSTKDGHPIRVWLKAGITKTLKSGHSICVKTQNGPTVNLSPHKISYIAGSVWRSKTASPYASYPQYGHILNVDEIIDGKKAPSELGVKADR
jgi:oligopeptide transport system substrate-binding protein